jgi:short subunit dehydrogenase-like uncharacterized protein
MRPTAEYDLVVYGATGFTGKLVAEHLATRYGAAGELRWALAGRSREKLMAVRKSLNLPDNFPLVGADANDPASLKRLAQQTRICISTVGPYQVYGSALVAACAAAGTDYIDLCGEPAWMRAMIDAHEDTARSSGARIVFSCGFDSIPFELGVLALQRAAETANGAPLQRVKGRVLKLRGTFSGGTLASLRANVGSAADPQVRALLIDPFSLTPGFRGPEQGDATAPRFDEALGVWLAPFLMATINTRNVHRSNYLQRHRYGENFVYEEMMVAGPGPRGEETAKAIAGASAGLAKADGPKPGEGPSLEEREAGSYELLFTGMTPPGSTPSDTKLQAVVTGDRDPGYGSTSKMIAETALCLLAETKVSDGGMWTPAALLEERLIERLVNHAGLTVTVTGDIEQRSLSSKVE